jgi:hypothetical protein
MPRPAGCSRSHRRYVARGAGSGPGNTRGHDPGKVADQVRRRRCVAAECFAVALRLLARWGMDRTWLTGALVACGVALVSPASCGGAASHGSFEVDGGVAHCAAAAASCTGDADCCSGQCDPRALTCLGGAPVNCEGVGAACTGSLECCSLSCQSAACAPTACTSDGQACTSDAQCCGGDCASGACAALNTSCKTSGNACADSTECCSHLCAGGRCSIASSFCIQSGDACSQAADCCGGVCTVAAGQTLGTCGAPPAGATFCNGGIDGTVCGSCGDCCSRLCAPYGPYDVKVCQPAAGCHIDGDLCTKDSDCCGAAGTGLPGAGNVTCEIQSGFSVGVCRNPTGCNPEGNVCHYMNYACAISSARNDCCGAPGNSGACQLDKLGVPRCHAVGACVNAGGACAYDADCCGNGRCVPGPSGALVCQSACSASSGACSVDPDCCSGLHCYVAVGSTAGVCGGAPPPPTGYDAGPSTSCAYYGQACTQDGECCNGVPCTAIGGGGCAGQSGCTCSITLQ